MTPTQTYPLQVKKIEHSDRDCNLQNPLTVIDGPENIDIRFRAVGLRPYLQILHKEEVIHRGQLSYSLSNRRDIAFFKGSLLPTKRPGENTLSVSGARA